MNEQEHTDEWMDRIHRSYQESADSYEGDTWNLPSDQVWEKLDQRLSSEKPRDSFLFYFRRVGVLVLMLGLGVFSEQKPGVPVAVPAQKQEPTTQILQPGIRAEKETPPQKGIHQGTQYVKESVSYATRAPAKPQRQNLRAASWISVGKLSTQIEVPLLQAPRLSSPRPEKPEVITQKPLKKRHSYVSLNLGQVFPNMMDLPSPTAKRDLQVSRVFGLRYGWTFGAHWGLETGIGIAQSQTQYTRTRRFRFRKRDEQLNQAGLYESSFSYDLPDQFMELGSQAEVVVLRAPDEEIPDNTPLRIQTLSTQRRQLLEIPVLANYTHQWNKWKVLAQAGFLGRFLIQSDMVLNEAHILNRDLSTLRLRERPIMSQRSPQSFKLSYLFSLGIEYQFYEQWGVFIQPEYNRNIAKLPLEHAPDFTPQNYRVNAGIRFHVQ